MVRNKLAVSVTALAVFFMLVGGAEARRRGSGSTAATPGCQNKITLSATAEGVAIDASGTAEVRKKGTQQRFKVSMDAEVADGTTFVVYANGLPAGTITITLGDGELDLNNNNGRALPAGVDPVCSIGPVVVTDDQGTHVLEGTF